MNIYSGTIRYYVKIIHLIRATLFYQQNYVKRKCLKNLFVIAIEH